MAPVQVRDLLCSHDAGTVCGGLLQGDNSSEISACRWVDHIDIQKQVVPVIRSLCQGGNDSRTPLLDTLPLHELLHGEITCRVAKHIDDALQQCAERFRRYAILLRLCAEGIDKLGKIRNIHIVA